MISIEAIGSYKKEGDKIATVLTVVSDNTVATLTPKNYGSRPIYYVRNTESFNPSTIGIVSEIEDLTKLNILKELASNGHIILKEITDSRALGHIHACMNGGPQIDFSLLN